LPLLLVIGAAAFFNAAYSTKYSVLIFGCVICLVALARLPKARFAFYAGFAAGLLCVVPQLWFFLGIFGRGAIALWAILAFWIALFVALASAAYRGVGPRRFVWLVPFLWTGLEYFRSELYYLRFSWLNIGCALAFPPWVPFGLVGVYGIGFIAVFIASCIVTGRWKLLVASFVIGLVLLGLLFPAYSGLRARRRVQVAGVQMEFPSAREVVSNLDKLIAEHPEAQLLVLSEYTFEEQVPQTIMDWCREKQKYLVVGAIDPASGGDYYDTAFVIGPDGNIVFKQAKSVPIQFFKDGLPAKEQQVWESPWGKIGICICYDLSYSRVTDSLANLGAEALIVPTMDLKGWGWHEHDLHERIALVRAAEYRVSIFRVASSGISQLVDAGGNERATAPFPGEGASISGEMALPFGAGKLPADRYVAPLAVAVTAIFVVWLAIATLIRMMLRKGKRGG
jgi:apolipoprotein N-acyltransferase